MMPPVSSCPFVVETTAAKADDEGNKAAAMITKERVPEAYITRVKTRPLRKIPPLSDELCDDYADDPRLRQRIEACFANINYLVDMEQDCLRQHADKGYAEIGVDYTGGVKKVFICPSPGPSPSPK